MNAELDRFAKENRAKGFEKAQFIRSKAECDKTVLLAEAEKEAKILESRATQEAIRLTTEAYSKNKEFYEIYRYFVINEEGLTFNSEMVLSTDGVFGPVIKALMNYQNLTKSSEKE
jgi:membrane protease subunit HflC